jgi:hypothetical protein
MLRNYYYKLFAAIECAIVKGQDGTTIDFLVQTSCTEAMEATTSNVAEQMPGDDIAQRVVPKERLARLRDSAKALR